MAWHKDEQAGEMQTSNPKEFADLMTALGVNITLSLEGLQQGKLDKVFFHDGILFRLVSI